MNTLVKVYLSPLKWVITYVGNWILNCLKSSRRQKPGQPEQRSIPSVSRLLCLHVYMCVWADFCDSSRAIFFFYVSVNLPESLLFLQSASVVLFVFFFVFLSACRSSVACVCVSVSEALCQCVKADLTLRLWTGWLQGVYRDPSGWPTPAPHVCPCVFVLMWVPVCMCVCACAVRGKLFSLRWTLSLCRLRVCQEVRFRMLLTQGYNYWLAVCVCACGCRTGL